MIQGLHASSLVFADFTAVSEGLLANLSRRLPGVDAAGYPVRLHGTEYRLRVGLLRRQKRDLLVHLHLESKRVPFQTQLTGTVRLQEAPTRSRTKVIFEGSCSRNFASLSPTASTDAVRHFANESSRTLIDLLVRAIEGSQSVTMDATTVGSRTGGRPASEKPAAKRSD